VRGKIDKASIERKAFIKAIGIFIKEVLPNANPMKRDSDTQTVPDYTTPPPSYETPISTRKEDPLWLRLRYHPMKHPLVLDLKLPLMMMWVMLVKKCTYI
jgi:hypothetical protein